MSTEDNDVYVSIATLAARWGVSQPTARNHARGPGFPSALALGERSARWLMEEVLQWEQSKRTPTRRVVTGTWPQHRKQNLPRPARTRTIVRKVAA